MLSSVKNTVMMLLRKKLRVLVTDLIIKGAGRGRHPEIFLEFSGKPYEIKENILLGRGQGAPPLNL